MNAQNLPSISTPSLPPISFEDMSRMADAFAKSNLFGVKTKDAALSLLMIAQAEGIHPALAVMEYDIIEGKPARKAERLLARFQMSGGKVEWLKYEDAVVTGKFSHPQGSSVEITWDLDRAKKITFYKKDANGAGRWVPLIEKYNWKSYPRAMLRSRVISEGVRACFPGASLVTLTSEEAQDAQYTDNADVIDVEATAVVEEPVDTSFLKGKAAEIALAEIEEEFGACNSLEELAKEFARVEREFKRRLSAARWGGVELLRDNRETQLEKGIAPKKTEEKVADPNVKIYAKLMQDIALCRTQDDISAWLELLGGISGLERFTKEQQTKLQAEYNKKQSEIGDVKA